MTAMAIYHLEAKIIIVPKKNITCGTQKFYCPKGAPAWMAHRSELWGHVEYTRYQNDIKITSK